MLGWSRPSFFSFFPQFNMGKFRYKHGTFSIQEIVRYRHFSTGEIEGEIYRTNIRIFHAILGPVTKSGGVW